MRPHRLTLTAFGSFPGTETVDFDTLSEAGLFLVHGPTGAGKTTLLDALCFALYGVVPGQRNSARSLRCDHAPPSVGPSVTLEVTLRGRLLRIQRSPAWTRPKLRGTGVTEEKAKVIVSEHVREEGWQGLTTRADEAGDLVGGLLGMNADQFCQVAMLPQGDFARFLRADGEERRRLLERLFTVKVFTAAETWLAERRKQTWRESQEGRQEVEYAVKRLEEAAGDVLEAASSRPDGLACAADGDGLVSAPGTGAGGDGSVSAPGVVGAGGDGSGSAPGAMGRVVDGRGSVPGGVGPGAEGLDPGSHVPAPRAARGAAVRAVSPGAVPAPRSGADDPPTAESDPLAWSGLLRAAAAAVVNRATQACEAGEAALREHRERFERASALADRQRRHAEALAQRRTLDERAEERSDLLTVLDEAARADRVLPLINAARQRAAAASKARHLATDAIARATPFLDTRAHLAPTTPPPGSRPAVDPLTSSGALHGTGREAFDDGGRPGGPHLDEPGADAHRPGRSPGRPDAYALGDVGFPGRPGAGSPGFAVAPGVLAELERERLGEITRVSELLADESRLVQLRHELRAGEQEIVALSTKERAAAARLEELPSLVKAADDAAAKARLDAAMIPGAEAARSGAATRLEAIERRDYLLADVAAARTALAARLRDPALAYALTDLLTHLTGPAEAGPGDLPLADPEAGRIGPGRTGGAGGEAATRPVIDELVAWLTDPAGAEHDIRRRDLALGDALANLADHLADSGDTSVAAAATGLSRQEAPWRSVTAWGRPAERAMRDQVAALEGLRADEARLADLDERLAVLTGELGTLAEREAAGRAAVDELPAALHDMAARLAEARAAAGRLPSAAAARDTAASRLAAAGRRQELEGDLDAARAAHGMAVELAQDLRDRLQEVRQARIDGMAAELAAELADGQPCAVCGSAEHPAPAAPAGIAYAADDEIEAQAAYDAALAERQASDGLLSSLISRLDELAEAPAPEEAEAELAAAEGEMAVLAALAGEESACERAVLALEAELDQARDQLHETERRLTEARAEVSALTGERERIHARLEAARGADAGLGARRRRLGDEIRLLAELTRTAERVEEITARLDDALDTLARLLAPVSVPAAASVDSRADDSGCNGSGTGHHGAGHSGTEHSGTEHSGAEHYSAGHSGVEHSDAGHAGSGHYGAEHSCTGHYGAGHSGAEHSCTGHLGHSGGITGGGVMGDPPSSLAAGAALSSPDWSRPDGGDGAVERQPEVPARQADPRTWAARVTRAWAAAELDAADREVARLRSAASAHPRLASRAAELAAEHAGTADAFRELGLRLAACRTRCEELEAETVRLASRIDAARGADPTLTARLERLREEAQLLREAHEATQAAEAAAAEHRKAVEAAKQAAVAAGFADVEDVLPAVRTSEERERKAERLRELDAAHAAVTRALADPELVAAAAEPVPDLAAMAAAREEAERAHTALASARDRAERRVRRLAELHEELVACLDRWQPAADRHRLAERLAALANGTSGDNQWSMSLSSYVLGERLRQVVDAANERLDHMSDGRYQLQHDLRKTAGARGRAGGGLGLRVLDAWTGVDRDPATLSGGESFITSLALALGLADVVSAEAGGAEIGMLFVDEGFGTLDEDTLDGVLDILDGLRDGGRAVGIVSHVGELRTRIPAQLKVTKARAGSTLSVTAP